MNAIANIRKVFEICKFFCKKNAQKKNRQYFGSSLSSATGTPTTAP